MALHLSEPVGIDPWVDVVIHRLFGDPQNERILVAFLNAVLRRACPIRDATVLNPFQIATFEGQKSLILDVKAVDESGVVFQIEVQRRIDATLPQRILLGWARVYGDQLERGEEYGSLKPVVAIWLCERDLFPISDSSHLRFAVLETTKGFTLHDDARIDVLQFHRWFTERATLRDDPLYDWFRFFNEAKSWTEVPPDTHTPVLEDAMAVLHDFQADTHLNEVYRGRLEFERVQKGIERQLAELQATVVAERAEKEQERAEKEQALAEKEQALAEKEQERAEKEQALAEIARLRALLGGV